MFHIKTLGELRRNEVKYFEAAKQRTHEYTNYTDVHLHTYEGEEHEMRIETKESYAMNDPSNKRFQTMKFYLAAVLKPYVNNYDHDKYKWLNLQNVKNYWNRLVENLGQHSVNKFHGMIDWAERRIKAITSGMGMKKSRSIVEFRKMHP